MFYFRFALIFAKISHKYDDDVRKSLKYVLSRCYLGDWFVLYQLSQNVNLYFFRAFVKELRNELKDKPKRTKSVSKSNNASAASAPSSKVTAQNIEIRPDPDNLSEAATLVIAD